MTVAGPINAMTFVRDPTVLACAIGNKIFLYKVKKYRSCLIRYFFLSESIARTLTPVSIPKHGCFPYPSTP